MFFEQIYCDHCGEETRNLEQGADGEVYMRDNGYPITNLTVEIASANIGESAVLCDECFSKYPNEISEDTDELG